MKGRRGLGGVYQRGGIWWLRYSYRGVKRRESSESSSRSVAVALLKRRLGEMGTGKLIGPDAEKVTLADLKVMLVDDYALKGNQTVLRAAQCLTHVTGHFGETRRALDITLDALTSYAKVRSEQKGAPATVKMELAVLRRAFNLAVRAGRLPQRPPFPVLQVHNRRKGFFETGEFNAVAEHLDADVRPLAMFLFWSGWRVSEALGLEWKDVDLGAGIIRLDESKNGEPRTMPFRRLPALSELVDQQRERTSAVEQSKGIIVPFVFHREGSPIRSFRRQWVTACKEAGFPGRLAHDFRRTAARNLSRAGVPEQVIMALCGWKTRSVFDRYRIVSEADLGEGLAKLANATTPTEPQAPRVVRMRTGTERAQKSGR